jgi:predicted metal-binding protein
LAYQTIVKSEYPNAIVLKVTMSITIENFELVHFKITNIMHLCLRKLEKLLYDNNDSLAVSFIGGSCKLCKNDCNLHSCANPTQARIPLEAIGVNIIVETMKSQNLNITFPKKAHYHVMAYCCVGTNHEIHYTCNYY